MGEDKIISLLKQGAGEGLFNNDFVTTINQWMDRGGPNSYPAIIAHLEKIVTPSADGGGKDTQKMIDKMKYTDGDDYGYNVGAPSVEESLVNPLDVTGVDTENPEGGAPYAAEIGAEDSYDKSELNLRERVRNILKEN